MADRARGRLVLAICAALARAEGNDREAMAPVSEPHIAVRSGSVNLHRDPRQVAVSVRRGLSRLADIIPGAAIAAEHAGS